MKPPILYALRSGTAGLAALAVLSAAGGWALLHMRDRRALSVGEQVPLFAAAAAEARQKVNPNSASAASLRRLPGIGSSRAAAILAYRQAHGPAAFRCADDLDAIAGIGPLTVARLADLLALPPHAPAASAPAGHASNRRAPRP